MNDFNQIIFLLKNHWIGFLNAVPSIIIGILILGIAWILARIVGSVTRKMIRHRVENLITQDLIARTVSIMIFLFGVYLIFEMANLTAAALTVISGTGVIGIILGIAFRDITENFLASILLSINQPFHNGDLVEIANFTGFVQSLTMRVTLLMSQDGHHIQIPNSLVYKSHIRNFTSSPNRREDFIVPIAYQNSTSDAQDIALKVLEQHDAVLSKPEPFVLVESLAKNIVNLRIYYWYDGRKHSGIKIKSSVLRLVKRAFEEKNIAVALDKYEILFPEGSSAIEKKHERLITDSETGLHSQNHEIQHQAKVARMPEKGNNLLS